MTEFVRVWKEFDIQDVSQYLLVVGDVAGDCSKCRELGIDYSNAKFCPKCGTTFKYIASRTSEIKRITRKRPDLIFIDFQDYKKALGKIKAQNLFS